ncbi:galactokinase [Nocardioides sp. BGMRC 2183]|nr:galactokinase [Nocardioides sp. BGMRC 2183]
MGKDGRVSATALPTVTAFAPGRVNLIGEHTDYNGGQCLPFAIPLATTATLTLRDDGILRATSDQAEPWTGRLDDVTSRQVTGWASYVAGVVWALDAVAPLAGGLDVQVTSTIPLGGGLSSSAALECSIAIALEALLGQTPDADGRSRIAEACRRAETEYVGAPTGGVDQLASMLGAEEHAVHIDFDDPRTPATTLVPLPLTADGLAILVTDTGARHALVEDDSGYARRRAECDAAAATLGVPTLSRAAFADLASIADPVHRRRTRHVVTENARVVETVDALKVQDWGRLGALLTASHESLRDDFEVSCAELDVAVEAALQAGARGARMTGGGFGGCTIALVHAGEADAVRAAIDTAYRGSGWPAPRHHLVQPSAGARVVARS